MSRRTIREVPRYPSWLALFFASPWAYLLSVLGVQGAPRAFNPPVRWLLSRGLLSKLKKILLEAMYSAELDHRDWMETEPMNVSAGHDESKPFWFDYVADIGDGELASYNLACLLLDSVKVGGEELPRGTFLLVGGDTAYPVADLETLRRRTLPPFEWARRRVQGNAEPLPENPETAPWVFALPGNHDLYDSLSGFNKVFTKPHYLAADAENRLADFHRRQTASYFCLELPYGYRVLGMHSEDGKVDYRQATLMRGWARELDGKTIRRKLIVATSNPSTVFGATTESSRRPFADLELPRPFLNLGELEPEAIHLDLSGDVHHYARYPGTARDPVQQPPRTNYQSVVAGGAAFLHASDTEHALDRTKRWPPPPAHLYPKPKDARRETIRRVLEPWRILTGGFSWAIGGFIAMLGHYALFTAPWISSVRSATAAFLELGPGDARLRSLDWREASALVVAAAVLIALFSSRRTVRRASKPRVNANVVEPRSYAGVSALAGVGFVLTSYLSLREAAASWSPLLLIVWLAMLPLCLEWVFQYRKSLPRQRRTRQTGLADRFVSFLVSAFGVSSAVYGVSAYVPNDHSLARVAVSLAVLLVVVGLGLLGWLAGAGGQRLPRRAFVTFLAASLGLAVLVIPAVLSMQASPPMLAVALLLTWALSAAASRVEPGVARVVYPLSLLCPLVVVEPRFWELFTSVPLGLSSSWLSFVTGSLLTCTWFGAYLGLAHSIGCHYNEAGIAARIDRFCHFIRFKVTDSGITGYVIGVERLADANSELKPVLVDRFTVGA